MMLNKKQVFALISFAIFGLLWVPGYAATFSQPSDLQSTSKVVVYFVSWNVNYEVVPTSRLVKDYAISKLVDFNKGGSLDGFFKYFSELSCKKSNANLNVINPSMLIEMYKDDVPYEVLFISRYNILVRYNNGRNDETDMLCGFDKRLIKSLLIPLPNP